MTNPELSNDDIAAELAAREPTLPTNFNLSLRGWKNDDQEEAQRFGQNAADWVSTFSRLMDLSRLEAVIIAKDYRDGIASVEREGRTGSATPTQNEYGEGGAMALHVIRDDEIWSVVVIWLPLVLDLDEPDGPKHSHSLHTIVHELAHVAEMRVFTRTYPGGWRAAKPRDARDACLQAIVNHLQSEYRAQRRSAWPVPEYGLDLLEMLRPAVADFDEQIGSCRKALGPNGDVVAFWTTIAPRLTFLFKALGYALGHTDWVRANQDEHARLLDDYDVKLKEIASLPAGWLLDACAEAVQPFWNLTEWKDQSVYDPLIAALERLLNQHGIFTSVKNGLFWIEVKPRSDR